jgi:hypothetical protein
MSKVLKVSEGIRVDELLNSEKILIESLIDYLVYERLEDSYRGWWGCEVKSKLVNILKECELNGDESDDINIYNEEVEKEKKNK